MRIWRMKYSYTLYIYSYTIFLENTGFRIIFIKSKIEAWTWNYSYIHIQEFQLSMNFCSDRVTGPWEHQDLLVLSLSVGSGQL